MKLYLSIVCLLPVASILVAYAQPLSSQDLLHWNNFKVTHGKSYKSQEEENARQKIFLENLKKIQSHNKLHEEGKKTYSLKMNQFGDLTHDEFNKLMNTKTQRSKNPHMPVYSPPSNEVLPESVDWRTKGAVTGVKYQGHCGSCWAFSTTGSIEGQMFLKKGKHVVLSEQQLVDCSKKNDGCSGGLKGVAFQYIIENGGIDTEDSYPYEAMDEKCRFKKENIGATIKNFTLLEEYSESALQWGVANVGPISVAVNADRFHFYSSGLFYESDCDPEGLNHEVLVVGYGTRAEGEMRS